MPGVAGVAGSAGGVTNLGSNAGNIIVGALGVLAGEFLFTFLGVIPALTCTVIGFSFTNAVLASPYPRGNPSLIFVAAEFTLFPLPNASLFSLSKGIYLLNSSASLSNIPLNGYFSFLSPFPL